MFKNMRNSWHSNPIYIYICYTHRRINMNTVSLCGHQRPQAVVSFLLSSFSPSHRSPWSLLPQAAGEPWKPWWDSNTPPVPGHPGVSSNRFRVWTTSWSDFYMDCIWIIYGFYIWRWLIYPIMIWLVVEPYSSEKYEPIGMMKFPTEWNISWKLFQITNQICL